MKFQCHTFPQLAFIRKHVCFTFTLKAILTGIEFQVGSLFLALENVIPLSPGFQFLLKIPLSVSLSLF